MTTDPRPPRRPVVRRRASYGWVRTFTLVAIVAVCLAGMFALRHFQASDCENRGGHWVDVSNSGICIDQDGRLLP